MGSAEKPKPKKQGFSTRAIHAGQEPDPTTGAISTPIYQTSTYVQEGVAKHKGYEYARTQNPTRGALEACLASLEDAQYGICFSSGMGAISALMNYFEKGDHVVASDDLYGGTYRIFEKVFRSYGLEFTYVDASNLSDIERAIKPNTKLIFLETPTNPLLKIVDLAEASKLAHKRNAIVAVDNTFATSYWQNPLNFGVDVVIHSTSKYLGGHCDVVGGAILTSNDKIYERVKFCQNAVGSVPGPLDAFLVLRGVKTLALRMERHEANARLIAQFLKSHPKVKKVYYPGLPEHPGYEVAKKQMRGFGGMISFEVKGGLEESKRVCERTEIFSLAESLGGVESLIEHPALMTHASVPREVREEKGISDSLIRISVGIEDGADLVADLEQALG
ncbi:MAG: cystathionine gamma-synthase [candidate division Zixibacteria bacterium]|nr:cystathionine gamma-synthase [candidate division Zixibacteria bacterium]